MNAGLCHNSPVSARPRQGRAFVTAGYSFRGTHWLTMGFHPVLSGRMAWRTRSTLPHREPAHVDVRQPQSAANRASLQSELKASVPGMEPCAPPGKGLGSVEHCLAVNGNDPHENRPRISSPASDARANRTLKGRIRVIGDMRRVSRLHHPTRCPDRQAPPGPGVPSASSERMSMRHPVRRAARRAFCPSLPIARERW